MLMSQDLLGSIHVQCPVLDLCYGPHSSMSKERLDTVLRYMA